MPSLAPIVSHTIRKMQRANDWPLIRSDAIERLGKDGHLPDPPEQAENCVLWLGESAPYPGTEININYRDVRARIGAFNEDGCEFILMSLEEQGLIKGKFYPDAAATVSLSFSGWERFHELTRLSSKGVGAFMAMDFNAPELTTMFHDHFKPAVARTGFNLFRLDEEPKAGSIDERLRVEIRRSRFLVADLTHDNAGAYWEAGFAEGLGKPVIYTCEKSVFEAKGTHFDTNHLQTVVWDATDPGKAAQDLAATVRNTLPDEAKMSDD
jgi:hypothetical protein